MNIPTLQALMIDLDGTMVDTMADFEAALNLALADIDLPKVDKSVVNIAVGKGSEHLVKLAIKPDSVLITTEPSELPMSVAVQTQPMGPEPNQLLFKAGLLQLFSIKPSNSAWVGKRQGFALATVLLAVVQSCGVTLPEQALPSHLRPCIQRCQTKPVCVSLTSVPLLPSTAW